MAHRILRSMRVAMVNMWPLVSSVFQIRSEDQRFSRSTSKPGSSAKFAVCRKILDTPDTFNGAAQIPTCSVSPALRDQTAILRVQFTLRPDAKIMQTAVSVFGLWIFAKGF